MEEIIYYLLSAIAALIALTVHEYSHGYAAYKMGDDTAKNMGRLTLNPIKHLDPYGAICMVLFHFGWAKPVPINPRNFKDPKKGFAITAAAGPLSNLLLGFITTFIYLLVMALVKDMVFYTKDFTYYLLVNLLTFISVFRYVNIGLALFNLIPIPPLDGSRLLHLILPPKTYFAVMKYERKIYYGILAWLFLGNIIVRAVRSIPLVATNATLYNLAGMLSLTNILGDLIEAVSDLMVKFWQLIPFLN